MNFILYTIIISCSTLNRFVFYELTWSMCIWNLGYTSSVTKKEWENCDRRNWWHGHLSCCCYFPFTKWLLQRNIKHHPEMWANKGFGFPHLGNAQPTTYFCGCYYFLADICKWRHNESQLISATGVVWPMVIAQTFHGVHSHNVQSDKI